MFEEKTEIAYIAQQTGIEDLDIIEQEYHKCMCNSSDTIISLMSLTANKRENKTYNAHAETAKQIRNILDDKEAVYKQSMAQQNVNTSI